MYHPKSCSAIVRPGGLCSAVPSQSPVSHAGVETSPLHRNVVLQFYSWHNFARLFYCSNIRVIYGICIFLSLFSVLRRVTK